jgi:SAM-dependent methyltransferase
MNRLLSNGIKQGKVLIFGSNGKPFAMLVEKLGFQVDDFNRHKTLKDEKENESETLSSAIQKIKDLEGEYEIIICDDIFQHLASPTATLKMLKDLLRPGGVLTITTPNIARGATRLWLLFGKNIYPWLDDHFVRTESPDDSIQQVLPYREYTLSELEFIVRDVELELIHSEFIIGKSVNANMWPPMPVKEYFLQKLFLVVQKMVSPFRNYLFVAGRKPIP